MTLADSLTRIRRFLRDPNGDIWTDDDVKTYFNDAQKEVAQKVRLLTRIETSYYPPQYTWSYLFDFEHEYVEGDEYRPLHLHMQTGSVRCYPWETAIWPETITTGDDGARFIHPWESEYCSPAEAVPVPLHAKFEAMKYAAFDNSPLDMMTERELMKWDANYRTRTGKVEYYYIPDEYRNQVILYPRPSTVVWQFEDHTGTLDTTTAYSDTNTMAYTGDWEHDYLGTATGYYAFPLQGESYFDYGMSLYTWEQVEEIGAEMLLSIGIPEEIGGMIYDGDSWLDQQDVGLAVDVIDTDNALLMVYDFSPRDIGFTDGSDFPAWAVKTVEHATLERCFGADTDGYIPTLRDYWKLRKEIGINMLNRVYRMALNDRDYRLGGNGQATTRGRGFSLGSHYPAA